MTDYDEIVIAMDIVSTKKINTVATNVASTASVKCYSKKVIYRGYYILHSFISDCITMDNYCYLILYKTKRYSIKGK